LMWMNNSVGATPGYLGTVDGMSHSLHDCDTVGFLNEPSG